MSIPDSLKPLLPLALKGIADLLDTTEDRLPAGIEGLLRSFGGACYNYGHEDAHHATTVPAPPEPIKIGDTVLTFPPPPSKPANKPLSPGVFNSPTKIPPRRSSRASKTTRNLRAVDPQIPPPPKVPSDYNDKDK